MSLAQPDVAPPQPALVPAPPEAPLETESRSPEPQVTPSALQPSQARGDGAAAEPATVSEEPVPAAPPETSVTPAVPAPAAPAAARVGGAVVIHGLRRTRESTVSELLPRRPPALYSDHELVELERRIGNLGIFDHVAVSRVPEGIQIDVREKWTLIPTLDFARGKTFRDTYLLFGATEYNFLGTASLLSAVVFHEERGWNGELSFGQHGYHPERGALVGKLDWINSSYRFEDSSEEWYTREMGGSLSWSRPLAHGSYFTYELIGAYHYELVDDWTGSYHPPTGHSLLAELNLTWDHYRWNDLAPRGYVAMLGGVAGALVGSDVLEERLQLSGSFSYAIPLARYTSLMGRLSAEVASRGNPNFSVLLGGLEGVRGLDDALYRNWAQSFANLELRQSIPLFSRLAMQLVAFTDGAVYQQLDVYGRRAQAGSALGAGFGSRLIPTFLSQVLFRVDVARLLHPYREWFVQWGLSQYF